MAVLKASFTLSHTQRRTLFCVLTTATSVERGNADVMVAEVEVDKRSYKEENDGIQTDAGRPELV